mmetsp:Transcript_148543/g.459039  ORF Transcript_148543/g.459039 Transcript_148543/m.459039 type:complete len:91 (-) Transcript_148543:209-481(-)
MVVARSAAARQLPLALGLLALAASVPAAAAHAAGCRAGLAENPAAFPSPVASMTAGQLAATALNLIAAGTACLSADQRRRLSSAMHLAIP